MSDEIISEENEETMSLEDFICSSLINEIAVDEIVETLVESGVNRDDAAILVNQYNNAIKAMIKQENRKAGLNNIFIGVLMVVGGIGVSVAFSNNHSVVVCYGLVLVGVFTFLKGLFHLIFG